MNTKYAVGPIGCVGPVGVGGLRVPTSIEQRMSFNSNCVVIGHNACIYGIPSAATSSQSATPKSTSPLSTMLTKLQQSLKSDSLSESENDECPICLENKKRVALITCGHIACCIKCISTTLAIKLECPVCRAPVTDVLVTF